MLDQSAQGGKWMELLREIAPRIKHVALLSNAETGPPLRIFMPSIEAAASSLSLKLSIAPIKSKEEIEGVIAAQRADSDGGLVVTPAAFHTVNSDLIIALAARYRLPAIYHERSYVDSGGLMAYTPDYGEHFQPAAGYVDRILKGAKPAELPVQTPTRFELFINRKTAAALDLAIPQTLLTTAREVIE
jgi:putative ABC transport system substrate-binding protein